VHGESVENTHFSSTSVDLSNEIYGERNGSDDNHCTILTIILKTRAVTTTTAGSRRKETVHLHDIFKRQATTIAAY